jgi:hypothetical protein
MTISEDTLRLLKASAALVECRIANGECRHAAHLRVAKHWDNLATELQHGTVVRLESGAEACLSLRK